MKKKFKLIRVIVRKIINDKISKLNVNNLKDDVINIFEDLDIGGLDDEYSFWDYESKLDEFERKNCESEEKKFVIFGWGDWNEFSDFKFFNGIIEVEDYLNSLLKGYEEDEVDLEDVFDEYENSYYKNDFYSFDLEEVNSYFVIRIG